MPDTADREPTQRTPKGHKIPVPRRADFLRDLAKIAPKPKPKEADESKQPE